MAEEAPRMTLPPATETTPAAPTAAETIPDAPTAAETAPAEVEGEHQPPDLMTKAKTLAGAAQAKVVEGVGQYLDKAQDYLHQMDSGDAGKEETDKDKEKEKEKDKEKETETESGGGGAAGGFMKKAQGFFK